MVAVRPRMAGVGHHMTKLAQQHRIVEFLHPTYPDGANIPLTLYAADNDGPDLGFVHTAYSIIAGNVFDQEWLAQRHYPAAMSDPKMMVRIRDRNCRITTYFEATEVAHLVPNACAAWFNRNRMYTYCKIPSGGRTALDDDSNGILLRRDLHRLFHALRFGFVPKSQDDGETNLGIHVLRPGTAAELMRVL
ncbi:hypothetical protein DL767_011322 [Monosporascus sp. MG133]|nr:hypothetical protein DL767_011322 [Monosporascus sp. MG133]